MEDLFFAYLATYASENTEKIYRREYERFLSRKYKPPKTATNEEIYAYIGSLKGLAPATIALSIRFLRTYLRFYDRSVKLKEPKYQRKHFPILTKDEFIEFSDACENLRERVVVHFLYDTGMRVSELVELNVSDLDLNRRLVRIETKKRTTSRVTVWSEFTSELIQEYIKHEKPWFISGKRGRLTKRGIERIFEKIGKRSGIKATPHSMRHQRAQTILRKNGSIRDVQTTLGHSSMTSCEWYLDFKEEEAVERANKFL